MSTVSVTDAKTNLNSLVRETAESHEPILITAHGANAVLLSEDDWRSVQETLYLLSIPRDARVRATSIKRHLLSREQPRFEIPKPVEYDTEPRFGGARHLHPELHGRV